MAAPMPRPAPVTIAVRRPGEIEVSIASIAGAYDAHGARSGGVDEVLAIGVAVRAGLVTARHDADARTTFEHAAVPQAAHAVAVLLGPPPPLLDRVPLREQAPLDVHTRSLPGAGDRRLARRCPLGEFTSGGETRPTGGRGSAAGWCAGSDGAVALAPEADAGGCGGVIRSDAESTLALSIAQMESERTSAIESSPLPRRR